MSILEDFVAQVSPALESALQSVHDVAVQEGHDVGYTEGFAAGVASVVPGDGLFTQAQVDVMIADAIALAVPAAVLQAQVELKAVLLSQYEAQQVVENDSETGFKALLS